MRPAGAVFRIAAALVVSITGSAWGAPSAGQVPDLAWSEPATLFVIQPDGAILAVADPAKEVVVEEGERLALPVRPGDRVRVEGGTGCIGLDFGTQWGEAVTWTSCFEREETLRVPSWSSAGRVVVRAAARLGRFRVRVAQPVESAMKWYRADEAVKDWLERSGNDVPWSRAPNAAAREALAVLGALEAAWGDSVQRPLLGNLLHALWLERAAVHRPLRAPFAHSTRVRTPGSWDEPGVVLDAGQVQILSAPSAEVVTLLVEGDARYETVVRVFEGGRLLARERIRLSRHTRARRDFSLPALLRFAARNGSIRVEVERGRARIRARAYGVRRSLTGSSAHRLRSLLVRPTETAPEPASSDDTQLEQATLATWRRALLAPTVQHLAALWQARTQVSDLRRLVLLHELVRLESKLTAKLSAAKEAAELGSRLDPQRVAPIFVSIVDELVRVGLERHTLPPNEMARLFPDWDVSVTDLDLQRASLLPPRSGARSRLLAASENDSLDLAHDAPRIERLREAWRSGAPFTRLQPAAEQFETDRLLVPDDGRKDGLCSARGASGADRWTVLGSSARVIDVTDRGRGFVSVPFLPHQTTPMSDGWALVNDTPIPVHLGGRVPTRVALPPGKHVFRSPNGMPLLAKIPRDDVVPCLDLRIVQSWSSLGKVTTFALPDGLAFTTARLTLGPNVSATPVRVEVETASSRQTLELNGAPHAAVEFVVPGGARQVTLRSSRPVVARVEARAFPRAESLDSEIPWYPRAALDEDALLEELETISRKLVAESAPARLRQERARLLERLGYPQFAERDLQFVPHESRATFVPRPDVVEQTIVPLGTASRLSPLPLPDDTSRIELAFASRERGVPVAEALEPLRLHFEERIAESRSSRIITSNETLLLATWAEEARNMHLAARALERIGLDHRQPLALKRADELRLESARILTGAAQRAALEETLLISAQNHLELGRKLEEDVSVPEAVVEASNALDWHLASRERGAGMRVVVTRRFDRNEPKGVRVRRALTGAGPGARLFTRRLRLGLKNIEARELHLSARCVALTGPDEACSLEIEVDGRPSDCQTPSEVAVRGSIPPPLSCDISLPENARRLTISVPEDALALAWAEVTSVDTGRVLERRVGWTLVEPGEPAVVTVRSPGLLRLRVRPTAPQQRLTVLQSQEQRDDVVLHSVLEPDARLESDEAFPIHEVRTVYVPVRVPGGEVVRVSSDAPLLVRIESAELGKLEPIPPEPIPVTLPVLGSVIEHSRPLSLTTDPEVGPLTLGLALSHEWPVLADADSRTDDRYVQIRAHVAREVVPGRAWVDLGTLTRFRAGPQSVGGDASASVNSTDGLPGGYFHGLALTQPGAGADWGGRWTLGTLIGIRVGDNVRLIPGISYTARYSAEARPDVRQDIDVYSRYALTRPRSLDGSVHLDYRPWVDGVIRTTAHLRLSPDFDGIDRADLIGRLRLLPGAGWAPFWDARLGVSYRPVSPQRKSDYIRASSGIDITFWRWLTGDLRLSAAGYSLVLVDFPADSDAEVSAALSAGVAIAGAWTFGRGVADFSPFSRPFRDRWEEGAAPVTRAESRSASFDEEENASAE